MARFGISTRTGRPAVFLCFLAVFSLVAACTPAGACGAFAFEGTVEDTTTSNALDMSLDFDFTPSECGSVASCDLVAWVQIVRTLDFEDLTYLYPSSEKQDRATEDGWYIDRLAGKIWGYYGRNDDGTFAGTVTTGSNTSTATLLDRPSRPEQDPWLDIWWMAVTVPVCLDEDSTVVNNLLGYYFWSWIVDDNGVVPDPIDALAWEPQDESVLEAVDEWNAQAPGLGKNTFPAFVDLT